MSLLAVERAIVVWARRLSLASGWLLLGLVVLGVGDAGLGDGFNRLRPGTSEFTGLVLAAVIFLGLPYTVLVDGHVTVTALTPRLGVRGQHALIALGAVLTAILFAAITVEMVSLVREVAATGRTTLTARIPVVPFLALAAAGAALATLASLIHAMGAAARAVRPNLPPPDTPPRSV